MMMKKPLKRNEPYLKIYCDACEGLGFHGEDSDYAKDCPVCGGKGYTEDRITPVQALLGRAIADAFDELKIARKDGEVVIENITELIEFHKWLK
jgi:RecJ-like exonuclease